MPPPTARRIYLATTDPGTFQAIRDATAQQALGLPVQIDFGFSAQEVATAADDRRRIAERYAELKGRMSFIESGIRARMDWLLSLYP